MSVRLITYRSTNIVAHSLLKRSIPTSFRSSAARVLVTQFHTSPARMGLDDWKERAPYKVHENNPNFNVRYEGSCHCGRVKYQLSRDKPLDAKYCHCTTCQTLHGESFTLPSLQSSFRSDHTDPRVKVHPFNGPPSSTRMTSISPTATMTWAGMTAPRRPPNTSSLAKLAAPIVARLSWTRAEI